MVPEGTTASLLHKHIEVFEVGELSMLGRLCFDDESTKNLVVSWSDFYIGRYSIVLKPGYRNVR
jgi:hypothetical protein